MCHCVPFDLSRVADILYINSALLGILEVLCIVFYARDEFVEIRTMELRWSRGVLIWDLGCFRNEDRAYPNLTAS